MATFNSFLFLLCAAKCDASKVNAIVYYCKVDTQLQIPNKSNVGTMDICLWRVCARIKCVCTDDGKLVTLRKMKDTMMLLASKFRIHDASRLQKAQFDCSTSMQDDL